MKVTLALQPDHSNAAARLSEVSGTSGRSSPVVWS